MADRHTAVERHAANRNCLGNREAITWLILTMCPTSSNKQQKRNQRNLNVSRQAAWSWPILSTTTQRTWRPESQHDQLLHKAPSTRIIRGPHACVYTCRKDKAASTQIRRHLLDLKWTAEANSTLGRGDDHNALLQHTSCARRAGSRPLLDARAEVTNTNNKHTAVRNC